MPTYESGLRPYRVEWVPETTKGAAPDNPNFQRFSDSVNGFDPTVDPSVDPQEAMGNPDPQTFFAGTIGASVTIAYDLQLKTTSGNTLIDAAGDPNDAAADGFLRNVDNEINRTHTIVRRMEQHNIAARNTENGAVSKDTRQYMVFTAAHPDPSIVHDPTDANPLGIELEYTCEKAEIHKIDQPGSAKQIAVASTDSGDTSQSVTIQGVDSAGAAAEETVALSGTTLVDTTAEFAEIDAVELSAETAGNVELFEDDDATTTVTQGDKLMELKGQNAYDHGEGDLGVPTLGTGSRGSEIGQDYESPQATTIERPVDEPLSEEVMTADLNANNNYSDDERSSTPRPLVVANGREVTADVTITGEAEYFDKIRAALTTDFDDYIYEMKGGTITLVDAGVLDAEHSEEAQQGHMDIDVTFRGQNVTLSA